MSLPQQEQHHTSMVYTSHRSALFPPACLAAATTTAAFYDKSQPPVLEDSFQFMPTRSTLHPVERTENGTPSDRAAAKQRQEFPLSVQDATTPTTHVVSPPFAEEVTDIAIQKTTMARSSASELPLNQATALRETSFSSHSTIDGRGQTVAPSEVSLSTAVSPSCQITGSSTGNVQHKGDKSAIVESQYAFLFSSPSASGSLNSSDGSPCAALQETPTFPFLHEDTTPDPPTDASPTLSPEEDTKVLEPRGSIDSMAATAAGPGRHSGTLSFSSSRSMSDVTFDERSLAKCSSSGSNSFFHCNDTSGTKQPSARAGFALQSAIRKACSLANLLSEKRTQETPYAEEAVNASTPHHNSPLESNPSYSPVEAAPSFECDVPPPLTPVTPRRASLDSQDVAGAPFADIINEGYTPAFTQTDSYPFPKNKTVVAHIGVPFLKGNETLCVPLEKGLRLQQFYQQHPHVVSDERKKMDFSSFFRDASHSVSDGVLLKNTRAPASLEKKVDAPEENFSKETLTLSQSGSSETLASVYSSKSRASSSSSFSFSYPESQPTGRLECQNHTTSTVLSNVLETKNSSKESRYDSPSQAHRRSNALRRFAAPTVSSDLKSVAPKGAFFFPKRRTEDHGARRVNKQHRNERMPHATHFATTASRDLTSSLVSRGVSTTRKSTPDCRPRVELGNTCEAVCKPFLLRNPTLLRVSAALRKQIQTAKCIGQRRGTLFAAASAATNKKPEKRGCFSKACTASETNESDSKTRNSETTSYRTYREILQRRGTPRPTRSRQPDIQLKRNASLSPEATLPAPSMTQTVEPTVVRFSQAVQTEKTCEHDAPLPSADALCKQRPTGSLTRPLGRTTGEAPGATTQQRNGRPHEKRSLSQPHQRRVGRREPSSKSPAQVRSTSLSSTNDSLLKPTVASAARWRHVLLSRNCAPQALDYLNNLSWSIHQKSSPERLWVTHLRNPKPLAPPLSTVPLPITTITRQASQTAQVKTQKSRGRLRQDEETKRGSLSDEAFTPKAPINKPSNQETSNKVSSSDGAPKGEAADRTATAAAEAPNKNTPVFSGRASSCETFSGRAPSGEVFTTKTPSGEMLSTKTPSDEVFSTKTPSGEVFKGGTINSGLVSTYVVSTYAPNGSAYKCDGIENRNTNSTTLPYIASTGTPVTNWAAVGSPTPQAQPFDNHQALQNQFASSASLLRTLSVPNGASSLSDTAKNPPPSLHSGQASAFWPTVAQQSAHSLNSSESPLFGAPHFSNAASTPLRPFTQMQNAPHEHQFSTPSPPLPYTASMPLVSSTASIDWTRHYAVQTMKNHLIPSDGNIQDVYEPAHSKSPSVQTLSTPLSLAPLHPSFVIPGSTISIPPAPVAATSQGYTRKDPREARLTPESSTITNITSFEPRTTNLAYYNRQMNDKDASTPPSDYAQRFPPRQNTNAFNTTPTHADHRSQEILYNVPPSFKTNYTAFGNQKWKDFSSSPSLTSSVCLSNVNPGKTIQENCRHSSKLMSFSTLLESAVRPETQRAIVSSRVPPAPYADILAPKAPRPKLSAKERYSTMVTRSNKQEGLTPPKDLLATSTVHSNPLHKKNPQMSAATAWIGPWQTTTYGYPLSCQNSYTMRTRRPPFASSAAATSYPVSGPPYGASYNPAPSHVFVGQTNNTPFLGGARVKTDDQRTPPPALESTTWFPSAYSSSSAPSSYGVNTPFPPAHFRPPTRQASLHGWPQASILSGIPAWQSPLSFQSAPYRKSWNAQAST